MQSYFLIAKLPHMACRLNSLVIHQYLCWKVHLAVQMRTGIMDTLGMLLLIF